MPITRRHFIALGFTAFTGAAGLAAIETMSRREGGPGVGDLGTVLGEPELWSAEQIGAAWLRNHPAEADRAKLERLLAPLPAAVREARSLRDPAVRAWLRPRQRADFDAGRVEKLDGWWLSLTEARFCAFLSLA